MEDASFESRRANTINRRRSVQIIGFALLGLLFLGVALRWIAHFVVIAADQAHLRRARASLAFPELPTTPGVYPVTASPYPGDKEHAILSTPMMPLTVGSDAQQTSLKFQVQSVLERTQRREPSASVRLTLYGPPSTWHMYADNDTWRARTNVVLLFLSANGGVLQVKPITREYVGEGWSLREQDRLDFEIPIEFFVPFSTAPDAAINLNDAAFALSGDEHTALRNFAAYLQPGVEVKPPKE